MVHGFDHVRVESRVARLLAVFLLSPPRERDQHHVLSPWFFPDAPADFIVVAVTDIGVKSGRMRPAASRAETPSCA